MNGRGWAIVQAVISFYHLCFFVAFIEDYSVPKSEVKNKIPDNFHEVGNLGMPDFQKKFYLMPVEMLDL
jgi:hypothetical protein